MGFSGCDLYKGHWTLPPKSPDWRQLGLGGGSVLFEFFVKNAHSVTPNCKLISFSLVEGGKKKRSQNSCFCFQIECLSFPMWRDFSCQRLFFISCLKSCNGKENILADFSPFHQILEKVISDQANILFQYLNWKSQETEIPTIPTVQIRMQIFYFHGAPIPHPRSPEPSAQLRGRTG